MNGAKEYWDSEYSQGSPHFKALSSDKPSSAVVKFVDYLVNFQRIIDLKSNPKLLEVGCGMGRNANYLARLGFDVSAFDISEVAVTEAKRRANVLGVSVHYGVWNAAAKWKFARFNDYDFIIDVATMHLLSDFERKLYKQDVVRTLMPGGRFLVYTLDRTADKNAQKLVREHPGLDPNSYILPGMEHQEKVFMWEDLVELFDPLEIEEKELIHAPIKFGDEIFDRYYWWMVFKKRVFNF